MKYLKNLLSSLKTILFVYFLQYLLIFLISIIYLVLGYNNLDHFISNGLSIILSIVNLILIFILIKKYHIPNKKLNKKSYYPLILLGISISCFCNMLIFLISKPQEVTIPLYISIISTGFIGPILEEILFRYLLLNNLKKFNSPKKSIIIATIIFALIHGSLIKIIYAFILGLILNYIYNKYDNIKATILIHISANIISIFLLEFNIYILILSFLGLIISQILIPKTLKN